jgi:cellulose biosynthesis protein BcsQ
VLVPLLAEPACLATVPGYELYLRASAPHAYPARTLYAVNRLNPAQEVSCDALHVLRESLPGRVLDPAILDDEYLREALARGEPHAPAEGSQGAADFEELAEQVLALLAEPQTVSASRSKAPPHVVR